MHTSRTLASTIVLLATLLIPNVHSLFSADDPNLSAAKEQELLAILRSDAPNADKALTCKKLAVHGSAAAVGDLAKLLPDPQLSSWARIALEVIPGSAADEALRKATESLDGLLLVGTINSIGVRRDAAAVELLSARLQDKDTEVASAAAVALGRIGNDAAAKSLRNVLASSPAKVRSAVAEGCVLCAERLHTDGKSAEAVAIYDAVRKADVPQQRIIEATRGAILARKEDGLPLLVELLKSPDKAMFRLALGTTREFPGKGIDQALAAELESAQPERGAMIIMAMADRPETIELSAVLKGAAKGAKPVRLAALAALGRVGDATCVAALIEGALDSDKELAQEAKDSLARLANDKVDSQIVALLPTAQGKKYPLLIELIGQRRIDAVPELLKALENPDQSVQRTALTALGETIQLPQLSVLVAQVVKAKSAEDSSVAQQALKSASVRMPDREDCAAELKKALETAPNATKITLLEILAEVGGTTALQTLGAAAKNKAPELQDAGSRLLGKWNSVDAAPVLLDLAKTAPEAKYQVRALRGYIGLARKFAMPEAQRAEMCQQALTAAGSEAEQKLALEVLKLHPSAEGLQVTIRAINVPALKEEATQATLIIAQKVGGKGVDVSKLLAQAGLEKVKLEIIKAEYGSGSTLKDVTDVLRKHVSDLPLITLPSAGFNANFGGDPLPGSVKQLKVQYRINGKAAEATFAEDSLIIFSSPK